MNRQEIVSWGCLILYLAPLFFKALYVYNYIGLIVNQKTRLLGALQVFVHDSPLYFALGFLFYLSFLPKAGRSISMALRLLALVGFGVYVLDVYILYEFFSRLTLSDFLKYYSYAYDYLLQISSVDVQELALLILKVFFLAGIIFVVVFSKVRMDAKASRFSLAALILFLLLSFLEGEDNYTHTWLSQNLFKYNLISLSEAAAYSEEFERSLAYEEEFTCEKNKQQLRNIIVLMIESLSSYQSKLFSGIQDWTPNIDAIAKDNNYFTNFYANGFNTEDGQIALLTGELPIYAPSSYSNGTSTSFWRGTPFNGFYDLPHSLPNILKKRGYRTEFLTSGDLWFSNVGEWAKSIGFDHIEGNKNPFYDGWERYVFDAPPDEALFKRVIERVKANIGKQNFFLSVATLTSHPPFINPENNKKSVSETFRYTDKQVGKFYKSLQEAGFFENGILIIVGDHRAMVPINKDEIEKFGPFRAGAKIPLIIVDAKNVPVAEPQGREASAENLSFQQVDIYNSLKNLVSEQSCTSDWAGNLIGKRVPPRYIVHRRGDNRNHVSIFVDDKDFLIRLDGDRTDILNPEELKEAISKRVVAKINHHRISRIKNILSHDNNAHAKD